MARLWSPQARISTWRRLWVALAEAEQSLGLTITDDQIAALCAARSKPSISSGRRLRKAVPARRDGPRPRPGRRSPAGAADHPPGGDELLRHRQRRPDPDARGSGARPRQDGRRHRRAGGLRREVEGPACLGYTHFQPAQLVTVGKRATLWCHELVLDLEEIERRLAGLEVPGSQGNDRHPGQLPGAVRRRPRQGRRARSKGGRRVRVRRKSIRSRGRRIRARSTRRCLAALAGIAESAHRFGTDLRLLAHEREVEEPFEAEQIGSSAMAYKRNPMRAERMCSLARFALALRRPRARRPRPSGWSARSTTARSAGWSFPRPSWPSTRS